MASFSRVLRSFCRGGQKVTMGSKIIHSNVNLYFPESDCKTRKTLVNSYRQSCVFPFIYKGTKYFDCTYIDSPYPWCSTHVNDDNQFVETHWGICDWRCIRGDLV